MAKHCVVFNGLRWMLFFFSASRVDSSSEKGGSRLTNIVKMYIMDFEEEPMQYLPERLRELYNRWVDEYSDIEGLMHPLINLSDVFSAYCILADYFTDATSGKDVEQMLVGLRSADLLASALGRQDASFGGKRKYTEGLDICATLFFGLVKNHAFSDGNKRTGLLILLYQLQLFGYYVTVSVKEFEKLVVAIAANSIPSTYKNVWDKFRKQDDAVIKTLSYLLRRMVTRKNNAYKVSITMREFCAALEKSGITVDLRANKIILSAERKTFWKSRQKKEKAIPFHGWTRTVGAGTARDALKGLGIYDEIYSYNALIESKESMYDLVERFEEPLRRLKDK